MKRQILVQIKEDN